MNIDPRGVFVQTLRWCAVVLLLSFAWQTLVSAEEDAPSSGEVKQQDAAPKKAPPGPIDDFNRGVPRTSVEGYIQALRESDYERAAEYLDLRNLRQGLSPDDGPRLARELGIVLNRVLWIELDRLSIESDSSAATHKGVIRIHLLEGKASVLASIGEKGSLATDFQLNSDRGRRETLYRGEIGGGGAGLDLSTYKGSIELLDR